MADARSQILIKCNHLKKQSTVNASKDVKTKKQNVFVLNLFALI